MKPKMALLLLLFSASLFSASDQAYSQIPMNAQPGAIINHQNKTLWMQQNTPWVTKQVKKRDLKTNKSTVLVHEELIKDEASTQGMLVTPNGEAYIIGK
ncbi:MAG: hypothetical protein QNJ31_04170 [Candidatus Caenarcaniphilales bacterium]|nr:hypothetical protein [Candidatus Caenarcaniphilales bacterium]